MFRRAVLVSLFGLATAFLYAVQRDTSVRRRLVDPAGREPSAAAGLGRVLPEVRLAAAAPDDAVAELSRLGGVPTRIDPGVYAARRRGPARTVDLRLRNVTLAEALSAVLTAAFAGDPADAPVVVPRGRELVVLTPADARAPLAVRAIDAADLLPPDGPRPVLASGPMRHVEGPSDRQAVLDRVGEGVADDLGRLPGAPAVSYQNASAGGGVGAAGPAGVRVFGSRLIVTAPAVDADRPHHLLAALRRGPRPLARPAD